MDTIVYRLIDEIYKNQCFNERLTKKFDRERGKEWIKHKAYEWNKKNVMIIILNMMTTWSSFIAKHTPLNRRIPMLKSSTKFEPIVMEHKRQRMRLIQPLIKQRSDTQDISAAGFDSTEYRSIILSHSRKS
jgi:hypothetical protein